MDNQNLKHM